MAKEHYNSECDTNRLVLALHTVNQNVSSCLSMQDTKDHTHSHPVLKLGFVSFAFLDGQLQIIASIIMVVMWTLRMASKSFQQSGG